ncbi:cytochrome P450 714C3-like isoform X1 [Panicum hallii]|nr:cytochrome P450 714C3-like isoform X1 [Panicum hallii]
MEELPALTIALVILSLVLSYLLHQVCLRSENIRKKLRRQGVKGPKPTVFFGNTKEMKRIQQELQIVQTQDANNYLSTLFPHLLLWRETYGPVFIYSTGALEILHVSDPELVKDIGHCTPSELGKPNYLKRSRKALFGGGLFTLNGDEWAYQRKLMAPEFIMDKIKGMIELIEDATVPLLESWESILDNAGGSGEIAVDDYLRKLSADVIARVCFGSSFTRGEDIFCKLRQLQKAVSQQDALVGLSAFWKYLPTRAIREIGKLEEEVRLLILDVIKEHNNSTDNDLLRVIIDGAQGCHLQGREAEDFIIGNCKGMYFAGHGTTAVTMIWCLMLLAAHPEWQEHARAEAAEICLGGATLDVEALRRLKIITMVIQETLRLYPPASLMMREALTDVKMGGLDVPRGTIIQVARSMLHLDEDAWGPNAGEFRPDRFANGVAVACRPAHMYMPFGHGPRTCIGQNLAMVELKVVLARLLTRFSFAPSPRYRHAPVFRLTIEPGFGMPLVVTKL